MKGIGPLIVAVIALVMLITIVTEASIFLAAKSENVIRTAHETAVINGINSMEFLKDSLRQSLNYSTYQALYTLSQNGGYIDIPTTVKSYNNIPYWRIYDDTSGYNALWRPDLEKLTLNYLNQYVTALENSATTIPNYQVSVIFQPQDIVVKESSQNKLQFIGQFFTLSDIATMTTAISTQIQTLFDNGKANYVDKDPIQNAIVVAENSLPNTCVQQTTSYCENQPQPTCESLYPSTCPATFNDSIKQNILSLQYPQNLPTTAVSMETLLNPTYIKVSHTSSSPVQTSSEQDSSCGCAQTQQLCDQHGQNCQTTCVKYYDRITLSCTYSNYGAAKVLVTMTDTQNKYPVYDSNAGTTDMRSTKLNFYVLSSNDYSQQLIGP